MREGPAATGGEGEGPAAPHVRGADEATPNPWRGRRGGTGPGRGALAAERFLCFFLCRPDKERRNDAHLQLHNNKQWRNNFKKPSVVPQSSAISPARTPSSPAPR